MGCPVPRLRALGFDTATGGDEVLRHLVLARIIEPGSGTKRRLFERDAMHFIGAVFALDKLGAVVDFGVLAGRRRGR
jgi:hypothetical protein